MKPPVCTSLSPSSGAQPAQLAALQSWQAAGLRPVSLNPEEEIPDLRRDYGNLCEFRVAHRTGQTPGGRRLIPVADLLLLAARLDGDRRCFVLNADLQLAAGVSAARLLEETGHAVGMIRRITIDPGRPGDPGKPDPYGWDGVVLGPDLAGHFTCPRFLLGQPWWDYWIPTRALHLKIPLILWEGRVALHPRHEEVWNEDERARLTPAVLSEMGRGPLACAWRRWFGPKAERKIYRHPNHLAGYIRERVARLGRTKSYV